VDVNCVVLNGVGDAKVDEFETTLDEDKVGGFEVRMDNVFAVDGFDTFEHFFPVMADK